MKMIRVNVPILPRWLLVGVLTSIVLLLPASALAATLSLSPSTGVYTAGDTFTTRVLVNTQGQPINAADGTITFNTNELSVVRVSKGSIFNLWTADPTYSNSAGTITFSGGNPTGYTGSNGTILTVTFRSKGSGNTRVQFSQGSVLAADGRGTNVLTSMNGGSYTIAAADVAPEPEVIEYVAPANTPAAPVVRSSTHGDQSSYYTSQTAQLSWTVPSDVTGVRTLLDGNSGSIPTNVYDTPISEITLEDLDEGVQYFHIQFRNAEGWGRVTHYRLAVDSEPPTAFTIALPEDADLANPEQTLLLQVEDDTSAVERFIVEIDGGEPYEYIDETASGTITLPPLTPGRHSVIVEAFDEAGNSLIDTFAFNILAFDKPQFTDYPSQINEEVIPVITGITRANATVELTLRRPAGDASTYTVTSDESGTFTFIPEGRLSQGVYELSAVAIDENGAQSEPSDTIRIAVQQPGYIQIGSFLISVLSIIIPLVAMVALLILGLWYMVSRFRRLRGGVRRESREALEILRQEFAALSAELNEQKQLLAKSRKSGKLTKAESGLITTLEAHYTEAQKRVEKEIEDVEDIVE